MFPDSRSRLRGFIITRQCIVGTAFISFPRWMRFLFILIRKEKVQRLTLFETLAPIRKKHPVTVSGL